jgi:myosin V
MDRNRDAIPSELKQLMLTTTNNLLLKIFTLDIEGRIHGAKKNARQSFLKADTVTTKFKSQLSALMDSITGTDVQYVRCIKPNPAKSRGTFDRNMVSIDIWTLPLPHNDELYSRLSCLAPPSLRQSS